MVREQAGAYQPYQLGQLRGKYCVVWREQGKRRRYRLGVSKDRPEVEGWAALNEFVRQREAALLKETGMTVGAIWQSYIENRKAEGKNMKNVEYMWRALEPTFSPLSYEDVSTPMIVDGEPGRTICHKYALERELAGKSRDTIWTELLYIRTALQWAHKRELIPRSPYVWVPKKGKPRDVVITEQQVQAIIDASPSPHIRLFILLAIATSARAGAILDLTWDRVDFDLRIIDFRHHVETGILSKRGQKKRAVVPFGGVLATALGEAKDFARTGYVIEWAGKPVKSVKKGFYEAVRRAGLADRGITIHSLRHSSASWMADDRIDMRMIMRMLGHSSISVTESIYAKFSPNYLRDAANVIDLRMQSSGGRCRD